MLVEIACHLNTKDVQAILFTAIVKTGPGKTG
jgi:hypothetical protein